MTLEELKAALFAADPSAVLVAPRLLARVLHQVHHLPPQFVKVPHRKSCLLSRQQLFQHVEQDELGLEADRVLPPIVILLARPSQDELRQLGREGTLLHFWRLLFHANVHRILERRLAPPTLPPSALRSRIDQIGRIEFTEIRTVLEQEQFLFPEADERAVYIEFAAVYLELRFFLSNLRPVYFPAIRDYRRIDQVLAQDINAPAVFAATRLAGAPEPVERTDRNADEPNEPYWRLIRRAERAARKGDIVRAAVFRTQAAARAPSALVQSTRAEALSDLHQLTKRLQRALRLSDDETVRWLNYLPALLEKTDQGHRTAEARLLCDLQKVCVDHEREIYALDLIEWALSGGNRPIKRPLPGQRLVRIVLHLRSASRRLTMARVTDGDRSQLGQLLQSAQQKSESDLQERFRPILTNALLDVGLQPHNAPEHTAFHKMVEELLDRITALGFLTFSDLRDVISRNNLKLPDIDDPQQFVRGDPLLRLDRRLATALDGVYRRGEFYLRWLERATSLSFGTWLGRAFTRGVLLPFGGSMFLVEAVQWLTGHIVGPRAAVFGPLSLLIGLLSPTSAAGTFWPVSGTLVFLLLGFFLLGLIQLEPFRQRVKHLTRQGFRLARTLLVDMPAQVLPILAIYRVWRSWPFQLFYWYLFKPLLVGGLAGWWAHSLLTGAVVFVAATFLLNSRIGMAASAALTAGLFRLYEWIKAGLLENLLQFIVRVFKRLTDAVEFVLFSVDEWLRFRGGDGPVSMIVRAILGVIWFPVSYLTRAYFVVLIEPGFNPIKAPMSYLAAKFMWPFIPVLTSWGTGLLAPVMGDYLAVAFCASTVWLLPDAFGFLFWEMKENWSLYRANRPARLKPVVLGPHGETMLQLLCPGFHSGTLPKLYARLRAAERTAYASGSWRVARTFRHSLQEVERSVRQFLQRELLVLLDQAGLANELPLRIGAVSLASKRISFDLCHPEFPQTPLRVGFAEQSGWLLAAVLDSGWLPRLQPRPFRALVRALGGLFKLAGIHLVHEQVQAGLLPGATFEVVKVGLAVWLGPESGEAIYYDLSEEGDKLYPTTAEGKPLNEMPILDARRLVYARVPITWEQWVQGWEQDTDNDDDLPLREVFANHVSQTDGLHTTQPTIGAPEPPSHVELVTGTSAENRMPPRTSSGPTEGRTPAMEEVRSGEAQTPPESLEPVPRSSAVGLLAEPMPDAGTRADQLPNTRTAAPGNEAPAPARSDPLFSSLPRTFGRYQLLECLGEGGMGAVYLARDTTLDRNVALKVARPRAQESAEGTARFLREARAAAALQDEGICRVLDFGDINGTHYITMEYIVGQPLSKLLSAGQSVDPRRAATLVAQVARALVEAHRQGVIHRDLKPANIMIDERGRPKVVDFGLARREDDSTLTGQGIILGTPVYMSPEQVSGQAVGPATDIYSLGVILYQLLAGRLPFEGTLTQLTYLIVHQEPVPPSSHRPGIDPRLEEICRRAMAKDPAARYPSMAELAEALEAYLQAPPSQAVGSEY
jgi:predicted Ser/Thr protein kinase